MRQLAKVYDERTARALADLYELLTDVLFVDSAKIFTGKDSEPRYLVQYIDPAKIRELGSATENISRGILEGDIPTADVPVDFIKQWFDAIDGDITWGVSLNSWMPSGFVTESASEKSALNRWRKRIKGIELGLRTALEAGAAAEVAREAAAETISLLDETKSLRDMARSATGEAGASGLGRYFSSVAKDEQQSAMWWTVAAIGSIAGVLALGIIVFIRGDEADWVPTLFHLALALPLIGAASYVARIAGHHRALARWAKAAAVQVNTIPAFSQQLSSAEARQQLILELGKNVFATPNFDGATDGDRISAVPPELLETLKELVQKLPKAP
ncbi:hypothetical protein [Mycolicibacterium neworleansense]|nr:hypothetical protein [Mycolicibacterium neworleansense]MCV7365471.1 hypothetical protein [Mycolicibacterium neworleansense]